MACSPANSCYPAKPPVLSHPMHLSQPAGSVADLMATEGLTMVFQPVAVLTDGRIYGHEALVRTPAGCAWANPDALFAAARAEGVEIALELHCVRLALTGWAASRSSGRLFLNLSASALVTALAQHDIESMFSDERHGAVGGTSIVIELTEHEHVRDVGALGQAVARLRSHGARLALDDFGDGRSSLRLWSELKPVNGCQEALFSGCEGAVLVFGL